MKTKKSKAKVGTKLRFMVGLNPQYRNIVHDKHEGYFNLVISNTTEYCVLHGKYKSAQAIVNMYKRFRQAKVVKY